MRNSVLFVLVFALSNVVRPANAAIVVNSNSALAAFDETNGQFLGNVGSGGEGGVVYGPDGRLYWSHRDSGIIRVDMNLNGGVFVGPGNGPYMGLSQEFIDLDFGPDGNLYVSKIGPPSSPVSGILRYDGATGQFIDTFIALGNTTDFVKSFVFGPNQSLYVNFVVQNVGSSILRYNSITGQLIDTFVGMSSALGYAYDLAFGPDGNLYVSHRSTDNLYGISRYDAQSGAFIDEFVTHGEGGVVSIRGFGFDQSDDLYLVANTVNPGANPNQIVKFDGVTGDSIGILTSPDSGFISGSFLAFAPLEFADGVPGGVPELSSFAIWSLLGLIGLTRRRQIVWKK